MSERSEPLSTLRGGVSRLRWRLSLILMVISLTVLILLQLRAVVLFEITSPSMHPTLSVGDRVLMTRFGNHVPRVGDLVVFTQPGKERALVKRLIAIGPARVDVIGGYLFVNGRPSPPPGGFGSPTPMSNHHWPLRPGEIFVAGDNRPRSLDSRDYGPLPVTAIRGFVFYKIEGFIPRRIEPEVGA